MAVRRARDWLESQLALWKAEIRRAEEAVVLAKNELAAQDDAHQRSAAGHDRPGKSPAQGPGAAGPRRGKTRRHARRWMRQLPDAIDEYDGQARPFQDVLEYDLVKMIPFLEQKIAALEAYQRSIRRRGRRHESGRRGDTNWRTRSSRSSRSGKRPRTSGATWCARILPTTYWDPLAARLAAVLTAMDRLDQALAQMKQDCE